VSNPFSYSGCIAFDLIADMHGAPQAIECKPRLASEIHFMGRASLATAMLAPEQATQISLKPARQFHQFYRAQTECQSAMCRPAKLKPYPANLVAFDF